jgi:hypothetical protein
MHQPLNRDPAVPVRTLPQPGPIGLAISAVVFGGGFVLHLWAVAIAYGTPLWSDGHLTILRLIAAGLTFLAPVFGEAILMVIHWFAFPGLLPELFVWLALAWCGAAGVLLLYAQFFWGK